MLIFPLSETRSRESLKINQGWWAKASRASCSQLHPLQNGLLFLISNPVPESLPRCFLVQ